MTRLPQVASAAEALAVFDALDAVNVQAMLGAWRGESFASGHAFDGVLEAYRWHGKRFDSAEEVHPLVFRGPAGRILHVRPAWIFPGVPLLLRVPLLRSAAAGRLANLLLPLCATHRSRARLRMCSYRGRPTATMIYDDVPINDVFHRVDADTVLGMMDLKGMQVPFFFLLRRERR